MKSLTTTLLLCVLLIQAAILNAADFKVGDVVRTTGKGAEIHEDDGYGGLVSPTNWLEVIEFKGKRVRTRGAGLYGWVERNSLEYVDRFPPADAKAQRGALTVQFARAENAVARRSIAEALRLLDRARYRQAVKQKSRELPTIRHDYLQSLMRLWMAYTNEDHGRIHWYFRADRSPQIAAEIVNLYAKHYPDLSFAKQEWEWRSEMATAVANMSQMHDADYKLWLAGDLSVTKTARLMSVLFPGQKNSKTKAVLASIGLTARGHKLKDKSRFAAALQQLEESLTLVAKALGKNHPRTAAALIDLAAVQYELAAFDDAAKNLSLGLRYRDEIDAALQRALPDKNQRYLHTMSLESSWHVMFESTDAHDFVVERAVQSLQLRLKLAEIHRSNRDWDRAIAVYDDVIHRCGNGVLRPLNNGQFFVTDRHAEALIGKADCLMRLGKHELAVKSLDRADNVAVGAALNQANGDFHPLVVRFGSIAGQVSLAKERFDKAANNLWFSKDVPREYRTSFRAWDIQRWFAIAEMENGKPREAAESMDQAVREYVELLRKNLPWMASGAQSRFLSENALLETAAGVGRRLNNDKTLSGAEISAEWVLNIKGLANEALAEQFRAQRVSNNPVAAELNSVRGQLASLNENPGDRKPEELKKQLQQLREREQALVAKLGVKPVQSQTWIPLAEIRQHISEDEVFIQIARADSTLRPYNTENQSYRYVAWVVPRAGQEPVKMFDLGDAAEIDKKVKDLRDVLEKAPQTIRNLGAAKAVKVYNAVAEKLATQILHPLEAQLKGKRRIILSPDATLWLVPWQALTLSNGDYAVDHYEIAYVTDGRNLTPTSSVKELALGKPVVVANPDFAGDGGVDQLPAESRGNPAFDSLLNLLPSVWSRLPGTEREAKAIIPMLSKLFGGSHLELMGKHATEEAVKRLKQPPCALFATHGFFLDSQDNLKGFDNPLLRCGIALAGANNRRPNSGGILTGAEVTGLQLGGTQLTVLSACETGLGNVSVGEGVACLRQAFHLAGSEAVLATLWSIPDNETAELMSAFFDRFQENKRRPAAALQAAQLDMLQMLRVTRGSAHPYYWAAFTCSVTSSQSREAGAQPAEIVVATLEEAIVKSAQDAERIILRYGRSVNDITTSKLPVNESTAYQKLARQLYDGLENELKKRLIKTGSGGQELELRLELQPGSRPAWTLEVVESFAGPVIWKQRYQVGRVDQKGEMSEPPPEQKSPPEMDAILLNDGRISGEGIILQIAVRQGQKLLTKPISKRDGKFFAPNLAVAEPVVVLTNNSQSSKEISLLFNGRNPFSKRKGDRSTFVLKPGKQLVFKMPQQQATAFVRVESRNADTPNAEFASLLLHGAK